MPRRSPRPARLPRITGLETEYGCLVDPPLEPRVVVNRIRDWVFQEAGLGLIDLEERDWDEPAGNGGFLFNGGRVYVDMGHLEYCTPECRTALQVVHYDAAGDHLLQRAVQALDLADRVSLFRNNVDHYTGATFGCHENYSILRDAPLTEPNVLSLLAFLTLRVLFAGAGRVGSANPFRHLPDRAPAPPRRAGFQLSQRADHIQNDFYEWVQHNRAIINTRDEPLADPGRFRRLHLLHGDTNVLPAANFLKVGSTRLVLDLLELDRLPQVALADAVLTLKSLSRRTEPPWPVALADGAEADAVALLQLYLDAAQQAFAGQDAETDAILGLWAQNLAGLKDPARHLVGLVDWVTKLNLLDRFRTAEGLGWDDPWLEAQDLEYHCLDSDRCLARALPAPPGPWDEPAPADPILHPPRGTRARRRSAAMHAIQERRSRYFIDWDCVAEAGAEPFHLADPFIDE